MLLQHGSKRLGLLRLTTRLAWYPAGSPLELVQPDTLRWKVMEPVLLLGKQRFEGVDIRIRAKGGGHVSQIYGAHRQQVSRVFLQHSSSRRSDVLMRRDSSCCQFEQGLHAESKSSKSVSLLAAIRQAIAKGLVAYYQKCELLFSLTF